MRRMISALAVSAAMVASGASAQSLSTFTQAFKVGDGRSPPVYIGQFDPAWGDLIRVDLTGTAYVQAFASVESYAGPVTVEWSLQARPGFTMGGLSTYGDANAHGAVSYATGRNDFVMEAGADVSAQFAGADLAPFLGSGSLRIEPVPYYANPSFVVTSGTALVISHVSPDQHWGLGSFTFVYTPRVTAGVPEPTTWATLTFGFGLIGAATRRRRLAAV